jgi:hypothetical protein
MFFLSSFLYVLPFFLPSILPSFLRSGNSAKYTNGRKRFANKENAACMMRSIEKKGSKKNPVSTEMSGPKFQSIEKKAVRKD